MKTSNTGGVNRTRSVIFLSVPCALHCFAVGAVFAPGLAAAAVSGSLQLTAAGIEGAALLAQRGVAPWRNIVATPAWLSSWWSRRH